MGAWPTSVYTHGPTIHPWSAESLGRALVPYRDTLTSAASNAWPSANRAYYIPFGLTNPIIVKTMFVYNGATAGNNFDVGIYDSSGTRIVSSGSTAQGTINVIQSVDITDTLLGPGLFFMALAFDGTTSTVFRGAGPSVTRQRIMGCFQQASAFALPATATFALITTGFIPAFGLCTRTVI